MRLVDDANIVEGVREAPEITRDLGEWDGLLDGTRALFHAAEHEQRVPSPKLCLHNGGLVACGAGEFHRSGGSRELLTVPAADVVQLRERDIKRRQAVRGDASGGERPAQRLEPSDALAWRSALGVTPAELRRGAP